MILLLLVRFRFEIIVRLEPSMLLLLLVLSFVESTVIAPVRGGSTSPHDDRGRSARFQRSFGGDLDRREGGRRTSSMVLLFRGIAECRRGRRRPRLGI